MGDFGETGRRPQGGCEQRGVKDGSQDTVRLWRAVEPPELQQIRQHGNYGSHPNSLFKRFALTEDGLDYFMAVQPDRTYVKTYIDIPRNLLSRMQEHDDVGGVGGAVGIDVDDHPEFYTWFDRVHIVGGDDR